MTAKSDLTKAEQQAACLSLRRAGRSYAEISAATSIPKTTVYRLVHAALEDYRCRTQTDVDEHIALQIARLDSALAAITPKIEAGSLEACDRMLKIESRRAALLGLDAPTRLAPTSPDGKAEYGSNSIGLAGLLHEARRLREGD
jgi:hypothetical protein